MGKGSIFDYNAVILGKVTDYMTSFCPAEVRLRVCVRLPSSGEGACVRLPSVARLALRPRSWIRSSSFRVTAGSR